MEANPDNLYPAGLDDVDPSDLLNEFAKRACEAEPTDTKAAQTLVYEWLRRDETVLKNVLDVMIRMAIGRVVGDQRHNVMRVAKGSRRADGPIIPKSPEVAPRMGSHYETSLPAPPVRPNIWSMGREANIALAATAAQTLLDIWACPNGKALGDCTASELREMSTEEYERSRGVLVNARFYKAMAERAKDGILRKSITDAEARRVLKEIQDGKAAAVA